SSAFSPGTAAAAAAASARDQRTPPVLDSTAGSSDTASTAAKPTPKRPPVRSPRFAEARSGARPSTPAGSSGAPVFAARSVHPSRARGGRPSVPAGCAAPAAFCAGSMTTLSRYAPRASSSSALASSRKRAGDADQASSTVRRRPAVPSGSGPLVLVITAIMRHDVERNGIEHRFRLIDLELLDPDVGMRAAAVVVRHDVPIERGTLVRADAEDPAERPRQEHHEAAGLTGSRGGLRDLGVGPSDALSPASGGRVATLGRKHPRPAEPKLVEHVADVERLRLLVGTGVAGYQ